MEEVQNIGTEREQLRNSREANSQEQEDTQPRDCFDAKDSAQAIRRREIEQEVYQVRQAELRFLRHTQELMERPTGPQRRFERGEIRLSGERFMRCAFLKRSENNTLTNAT
ncbi:unnamed protein product [Haemonchus placei]|uniref:Uncharacterized protein n=1 Tax=Haemonchus placei TaxID=6290 RepID=A0A0N4WJX7_HAEPC|nr:unnamed protein product [Haemonchus placei]